MMRTMILKPLGPRVRSLWRRGLKALPRKPCPERDGQQPEDRDLRVKGRKEDVCFLQPLPGPFCWCHLLLASKINEGEEALPILTLDCFSSIRVRIILVIKHNYFSIKRLLLLCLGGEGIPFLGESCFLVRFASSLSERFLVRGTEFHSWEPSRYAEIFFTLETVSFGSGIHIFIKYHVSIHVSHIYTNLEEFKMPVSRDWVCGSFCLVLLSFVNSRVTEDFYFGACKDFFPLCFST